MPEWPTFRDWLESIKRHPDLQPYQRDLLYGLPVRIVEDPVDPRVGYIVNEEALRPSMPPLLVGISTPDPAWPKDDLWQHWTRPGRPGLLGEPAEFIPPETQKDPE